MGLIRRPLGYESRAESGAGIRNNVFNRLRVEQISEGAPRILAPALLRASDVVRRELGEAVELLVMSGRKARLGSGLWIPPRISLRP